MKKNKPFERCKDCIHYDAVEIDNQYGAVKIIYGCTDDRNPVACEFFEKEKNEKV